MKIENIIDNNTVLASVIYKEKLETGIKFFTPNEASLQVGKHSYQAGKVIKPHKHNPVKIERFESFQEVLYIEKGKLKVLFYTDEGIKIDERILSSGDIVLLINGGHGFEIMEDLEMIEIKQGPFLPESKKELTINGKK